MSSSETSVERSLSGGVLRLVLNRPHAGNSFNAEMQRCLIDAFLAVNGDANVRAVVITASGRRHFCTGPDLRDPELSPNPDRRPGEAARVLRRGSQRVVEAMLECEKPILCGLNGMAAGGGANLVLAADLVVATEQASIVELFARRGLIPDGGAAYLLARRLPLNVAKELVFFGDALDAPTAQRLGLVNCVVADEDFEPTLSKWATRLAAGPTYAYGAAKQLLNRTVDEHRAASFALEAILVEQVASTRDVAEGVASFLDRREARFEGR